METKARKEIIRLNSSHLQELYPLFREFVEKDIPQLKGKTDFFLKGDYSVERVRVALDYHRILVLGYFFGGSLVGFLWGSTSYAGLGFISWLWVMPKYRNNNIASELLQIYETSIKEGNGHFVELYCFEELKDFYEKRGYTMIGRRPKGYFKLPQLIMNKIFE